MLFLGGGTRAHAHSGIRINNDSCTRTVGHTCIICGCLAIVTGLILIIIGVTSDAKVTTFVGVGVISLGAGFFSITLVCFYGKLDICYNNWAYRSQITPANIQTPRPVPTAVASTVSHFGGSPATTQKRSSKVLAEHLPPITVISEIDIHKSMGRLYTQTGIITHNFDSVT